MHSGDQGEEARPWGPRAEPMTSLEGKVLRLHWGGHSEFHLYHFIEFLLYRRGQRGLCGRSLGREGETGRRMEWGASGKPRVRDSNGESSTRQR